MSRIVVIGSSNMDLTVRTPHIPSKGETIIGGDLKMSYGGKGANQAVAAIRLGGDVTFVTKVGQDTYGELIISKLTGEGLPSNGIMRDGNSSSGVAWICVDENGDNSIVVLPGANASLSVEDLKPYIGKLMSADYILMQLEIPLEVVEYVTELAYENGVKVILNPAPACHLDKRLLSKIYMIVPNEKECRILCGDEACDDVASNAACLKASGVPNVLVTLGENGSMLINSEGTFRVGAEKVTAVDTVAAGDTFCGALSVILSEGGSLIDAMKFATKASAIAVTRCGAQESIPFRKEIKQ